MDNEAESLQVASGQETPTQEFCPQHPELTVVHHCLRCSAGVCETCDFELAGGVHLCPGCATHEETRISGRRRQLAAWSIGIGAWGVLAFILFFAKAAGIEDEKQLESLGTAYSVLGIMPCLIGAALGFSAFDRRLNNPRWLWAAPAVNTGLLAIFALLTIIGTVSE
jgi:hypothetical protein